MTKRTEGKKIDGKKQAAELLAGLDSKSRERILGEIAQQNPALAQELTQGLISFSRVLKLSTLDLTLVLRSVTLRVLALACRGLDVPDLEKILTSLPSRVRQELQEEVELIGPQKMADVSEARQKIADAARDLSEQGKLQQSLIKP